MSPRRTRLVVQSRYRDYERARRDPAYAAARHEERAQSARDYAIDALQRADLDSARDWLDCAAYHAQMADEAATWAAGLPRGCA